ncbi:hypothetical protein BEP19_14285 [Ammoniphilus oxalaticus]|uniref:Cytochrome c oxidase assembly factor CtaG n=1 Tax=Ammoniphilus oxalaticus TaxID=66863 RepID=A0A419SEM4_9BACL|nr:cytochrome c oxidase assembly protein [Ammoniphilus oxalaticus]RKD21786.1 hypothetical protein BEP19_14285 [Ammoniphilus oxalaticus]
MLDAHNQVQAIMNFGFWQMWDPFQFFLTAVMIYFYVRFLKQEDPLDPVPLTKKLLFFSGCFIYLIAAGGPINFYGHHFLLSAHMFQQALMYYVVPPLLILGTPKYVFEAWINNKWMKKLLETHLIIYLLAFDLLFSMYHLPMFFDFIMSKYVVMVIAHLFLFVLAIQMWWPILNPLPEVASVSEIKRMACIILGAVLLTPACALVIFADHIIYAQYIGAPQIFEILTPIYDQQLSGIVMKFVQEISFGSTLAYIFFRWYRKENTVDPLERDSSILIHQKEITE